MMLRQCKLSRPSARGRYEDVFWIDNSLAVKGKKVVDEEGVVWIVEALYTAKEHADVDKTHDQWREFAHVLDRKRP
jgi:hypothetical protein